MKLTPFQHVSDVPISFNRKKALADVRSGQDFIDISSVFSLEIVSGTNQPWFRGLSASLFRSCISFGFDEHYGVTSIEFRSPFTIFDGNDLFFNELNFFQPTLLAAKTLIESAGIAAQLIDVGFEVADLGISFFSDEYESDLDARLDAVTVHFHQEV